MAIETGPDKCFDQRKNICPYNPTKVAWHGAHFVTDNPYTAERKSGWDTEI